MIAVEVSGAAVPRFSRRAIATFARKVLAIADRSRRMRAVSVAFVDERVMRSLNRDFRRKNKTTDVLTFRDDASCEIVISLDQARRQAADQHHALATELRYLLLHGLLHGLGYDHETDRGQMNALEMRVRARVGLE